MFDASRRKQTLKGKRPVIVITPSSSDTSITTECAVSATDMLGVGEGSERLSKGQEITFPRPSFGSYRCLACPHL